MNLKMESSEKEFQELQEKRKQELIDAHEKIVLETIIKAKKYQIYWLIAELILTIGGYLILGFMVSWWLVLGIFLVSFGDRLQTVRTIYQSKKNIWKLIWKL